MKRRITAVWIAMLLMNLVPAIVYAAPPAQVPQIAILDVIIEAIDQYKTPIAIVGIMIIGLALLAKPIAPEWSAQHRGAITSMILGGILLFGAAQFAPMILGN